MKRFAAGLTIVLFGTAVNAMAATIADYSFTGESFASSDPGTAWTTGDISAGSGFGLQFDDDTTPNGSGNPIPALAIRYDEMFPENDGDKTLQDALDADIYYSFTVTPDALTAISYDEFSADFHKTGGASKEVYLLSDVDGFTDGAQLDSKFITDQGSFQTLTFDASSLVNVTDPVEFRFYYVPGSYTTGNNRLSVDNILLTGTTSFVPEPSAFALAAFGVLGLFGLARRWKP